MKMAAVVWALSIAATVTASAATQGRPVVFFSSARSAAGEVTEGRRAIEKKADESGGVSWESLSKSPWQPQGEVATIEGDSMPAMTLAVERSEPEVIELSGKTLSVARYRLKGEISERDPLQSAGLKEHGLVRVEIEGEGTRVFDPLSGDALAGSIKLLRKVMPSPWRVSSPVETYDEAVEGAWSKLP